MSKKAEIETPYKASPSGGDHFVVVVYQVLIVGSSVSFVDISAFQIWMVPFCSIKTLRKEKDSAKQIPIWMNHEFYLYG